MTNSDGLTICTKMVVEWGPSVSENITVQASTMGPVTLVKGLPVEQIMTGNVIPGITLIIDMTCICRLT
jgi:hypothetical protein